MQETKKRRREHAVTAVTSGKATHERHNSGGVHPLDLSSNCEWAWCQACSFANVGRPWRDSRRPPGAPGTSERVATGPPYGGRPCENARAHVGHYW